MWCTIACCLGCTFQKSSATTSSTSIVVPYSGWPMEGGNSSRSYYSHTLLDYTVSKEWSVKLHHPVRNSPIIGENGIIYISTMDGFVYALSNRGAVLWKYKLGFPSRATPAISKDDVLYCTTTDGSINALASNGNLIWSKKLAALSMDEVDSIPSALAISKDGLAVVVGIGSNDLYSLNASGSIIWQRKICMPFGLDSNEHDSQRAPCLDKYGVTYCLVSSKPSTDVDPSGSFDVIAIDPTGNEIWRQASIADYGSPITYSQISNYIIVNRTNHGYGSLVLDLKGNVLGSGPLFYYPPIDYGKFKVCSLDGRLSYYSISPIESKAINKTFTSNRYNLLFEKMSGGIVDANGTVVFGLNCPENNPPDYGVLVCMSSDGKRIWHVPVSNGISGTPALGLNKSIVIVSYTGEVFTFVPTSEERISN